MRCLEDEPTDGPPMSTSVNDRNRCAVAVTEENDLLELEVFDDSREHIERFIVHEAK